MKKIAIACDHAGFQMKEKVREYLQAKGYEMQDMGTYSEESVDYPDFAHQVARAVTSGQADSGILLCGSGNGISMAANKHTGIRAALCWNTEVAELARKHNNANILALPARFLKDEEAIAITDAFINTSFEGGRHERRVQKISC